MVGLGGTHGPGASTDIGGAGTGILRLASFAMAAAIAGSYMGEPPPVCGTSGGSDPPVVGSVPLPEVVPIPLPPAFRGILGYCITGGLGGITGFGLKVPRESSYLSGRVGLGVGGEEKTKQI